ncbi:MAG: hypothetical protein JJT75_01225 [Opitutales bacterium]|nr:hypothetical protein [Opitutales bacterium]MCH8540342.1 hypothetical protein [Opitutales bacterium]
MPVKPPWISLLGWGLIASGLFHLGKLFADWRLGSSFFELGFLTIPAGIALLQYHRFTARLLGVFSFLAAGLLGIFFLFPEGAALPLVFSLVSIGLLLSLGVLLFRSERHFDRKTITFNPRHLPRHLLGPLLAILALTSIATLGYYQVEQQNSNFGDVQEFQLTVMPLDTLTGRAPEGGLLYRLDGLESPGFARQRGFTTTSGGARYLFWANPPFSVHLTLIGANGIPHQQEIHFTGEKREKTVNAIAEFQETATP